MPAGIRKRRLMGEINVVPYIDVMLVLLIIFMVTEPLLLQLCCFSCCDSKINHLSCYS